MKSSVWNMRLGFVVALTTFVACGGNNFPNASTFLGGDDDGGSGPDATTNHHDSGLLGGDDDSGLVVPGDDDSGSSIDPATFKLTPAMTTLNVNSGQTPPTITFVATSSGKPVAASFRIADRGELASVVTASGLFTPTGALGGTVTVAADYGGATATASVIIDRHATQNGDPNAVTLPPGTIVNDGGVDDAGAGSVSSVTYFGTGGYQGVGGDGTGGTVTTGQQATLDAPTATTDGVSWLYPYDNTVFPRGVLPPLLQWSPGTSNDYDAVKIHLVESGYDWTGYFSKPALSTIFNNHPIPNDAWTSIYNSYASTTGAESLTVTVTVLAKGGAASYALPTRTWRIAGGSLRGKIYYQSYGTHLATQSITDYNGVPFGGATLGIAPGAAAPDTTPIAGFTSPNDYSGCRVCHSVASGGSALVTQNGTNYSKTSEFTLANDTEVSSGVNSSFPGLSPDGTVMFTNGAAIQFNGTQAQSGSSSGFYSIPSGTQLAMRGLSPTLLAYFPTFSPDGSQVAYLDGSNNDLSIAPVSISGLAFGPAQLVYQSGSGSAHWSGSAYWPSFTPTNDGIVFEVQTLSNGRDTGGTRSRCDDRNDTNNCSDQGAHGELWYINTKTGRPVRLDAANGLNYVPPHPTAFFNTGDGGTIDDRTSDYEFNYEPTVNPVVSGGYAWIVFTSRRRYGNVATINPFHSDPRFTDISMTPTTKKLWVAAIDLSGTGSTDVSYPAFYLPGQELLAGNARGYWVVDPCQADGTSCGTGDQCCGGYCQKNGDGGALVCSTTKPMCASEYDKCTTASDCCGTTLSCIDSRCAGPSMPGPR